MAIFTDLDHFNELLNEAVAERGEDFVYRPADGFSECRYVEEDGTPGCIVGLVYFKETGERVASDYEGTSANVPLEDGAFKQDATVLAARVQNYQDDEWPWGEAVTRAREDLALWIEQGRPYGFGELPKFSNIPTHGYRPA